MKTILCTECNSPIHRKSDLAVAGKLMQPYHSSCLAAPSSFLGKLHRFIGQFPKGIGFWLLLLAWNMFLVEMARTQPHSLSVILIFGCLVNAVFIAARIAIYYSYERYLQ